MNSFCALCNRFSTDVDLHLNGCVHIALVEEFIQKFNNQTQLPAVLQINTDLYKTVMKVHNISKSQERTLSVYELTKNLSEKNRIAELLSQLQKVDTSEWDTLISAFDA